MKTFEEVLSENGIDIGISGDKNYQGSWEWFERETKEWIAGFDSKYEAYISAREYLVNSAGIEIPDVDDNGDLLEH